MSARARSNNLEPRASWHVYVDFDGTIVPDDPTDRLFDRFADACWREIEQEWQQGRLTSRECMARQVGLLRASPRDLEPFLAELRIDPGFPGFVRLCRRNFMNIVVVSDGLDLLVGSVLRAAGLDLPFRANKLEWQGGDRWSLQFPHMQPGCSVRMGNCKCSHGRFGAGRVNIMVGDGRSDFCVAEQCDWVLAKGKLAQHCRQQGLSHVAIDDFSEATLALSERLADEMGERLRTPVAA